MRLSNIIKSLQQELQTYGDVEVYQADNDGRSTSKCDIKEVKLSHGAIWKGHPAGKFYKISFTLSY